jgi:oxalate decarboxylase
MSSNSAEDKQEDGKITRRDFMKLIGAAGALATLPTLVPFSKVFGVTANETSTNQTGNISGVTNDQNPRSNAFNLDGAKPQFFSPTGSRTIMTADNFPILKGMGAVLLRLQKGGTREPHWHPNAAELCLCLTGDVRMTVYSPGASHDTFTVGRGDITFVPSGYVHDVENIGTEEAKLIIVYNNDLPEDLGISGSIGSMSARVLDRFFGINPPGFFDQLNYRSSQDVIVGPRPAVYTGSGIESSVANSHKFSLEKITPQIKNQAGTAVLGTSANFPILNGLAVFIVDLKPTGMIEPHTHPNAAELNYVINGKVRYTVFSPGGHTETGEIGEGEVFFVPQGYFHYLENPDNVNSGTVASFFGNENPNFIGIVGSLSAYSNEVLASVFSKDPKLFSNMPRIEKNVFLASETG